MNKIYLGIIFAIIMLMSIGAGYAALGVGSWVSNNDISLSITNGDTAEFRYGINAVTIYDGKYSINLYRDGSASPIYTYINNVATIDNGALGRFNVTPSNYGNLPGNYHILIDSQDKYSLDSFRLNLEVVKKVVPLTVTCNANPTTGVSPLNVAFNAQANGGTGTYTYKWTFGDNSVLTNTQSQITHIYNDGTFTATVTVIDSDNSQTTANCVGNIVVTKPITPITGTCNANPKSGTAPLNVDFTTSVSGGTGTYTYSWTLGDGYISAMDKTLTHVYNIPGTYNPTVKITDSQNNQATFSCGTISSNNPVVPITVTCNANPKSGTTPLDVALTSQVSGGTGTYTYKWTFGDGTSGTSQNTATHTYNTEGTYTSTLMITDSNNIQATANCGSITTTKPVTPITITCTATPLTGFVPLDVAFNAIVSGGTGLYSYKWNFGDSSTNTNNVNQIFAYTYYKAGTYSTSITVTDSKNNQATASCGIITVKSPVIPISASCTASPSSGSSPLNVNFNSQVSGGTGGYTYKWTFGDGATNNNPSSTTHTYSEGTYNPTLKITDNTNNQLTISCGTITANKKIEPLTGICTVNPINGTSPLTVTLNVQPIGGVGPYTYKWNYADGTTNNNPSTTTHVYTALGIYNVLVDVTDSTNNKATISCESITVYKKIEPITVTCNANPTTGTTPINVAFNAKVTGGTGTYTYKWTFGDGLTGTNQNTETHTYNTEGTYTTKLTITDTNNNQATANCGTIVATKPVAPITVTCNANPKSGTTPLNVNFNSQVSGGTGTYTYKWTFGDGTSGTSQNTVTHTYNTEGTYTSTLMITDSNNIQATANCGNIVASKPIIPITANCNANPKTGTSPLSVAFTTSVTGGTGGYTYSWTFGDGATNNNPSSTTHTYSEGTYNPTLKITDNTNNQLTISCGTITANKKIEPLTGMCTVNPVNGTSPLTVSLNLKPIGGVAPYTYKWNYADGTTNNNPSTTTHVYTALGIYNVLVDITDSQNNKATISCESITVYKKIAPITVTCNANPTTGTTPLNVNFNSQVSGGTGIYTYKWTFGDGALGSRQNSTTHTYTTEGTYTTKLTITDTNNNQATANCGNIIANKPIVPLTVSCNANPTTGTSPLSVAFTTSVTGGTGVYTYIWTFADGTTGTNPITTSHTYTEGTYYPNVKITDSDNNQATMGCGTITANKPIAPIVAICTASPTTGNIPLNVNFNSQTTGGTGSYAYKWTYGDGSTGTNQKTSTHTYTTAGKYYPTLKITDSQNNAIIVDCADSNGINTIKPTPVLNIDSITCFPRITDGKNQSCSVFVKSSDGQIAGNVNIKIYYSDGTLFNSCKTDSLSGGCEVKKEVYGVGTYTVYATADSQGYISDNDKNPKYTFEVFAQRYDVINLDTYKDSNFYYPEHTFYRGQALYAKFQVYDPIAKTFVTKDIVTAAALVSLPGGRADLSKITYTGNWYYYKLDAIPLSHDFLGDSNVFAFAFNFTGLTSGQAQVNLNILNNKPTISDIADVYVKVGQTYNIPLNYYGTDKEDKILQWQITNTPNKFTANIDSANVLSITGIISGDDSLMLKGYDLDKDYANTTVIVHVLPVIIENNLTVSCSATPNNGDVPLNVALNSVVSGGSGTYTYLWSLGDGTVLENSLSTLNHIYITQGIYSTSLTVTDSKNNVVSANCGQINVNEVIPTLTASCTANPKSGITPFDTQFTSSAIGGIGPYTYIWTFGDGQSATTPSTTDKTLIFAHTYNIVGAHNALLTITDSANNVASADCGQIIVNEIPHINLDVTCMAMPSNGEVPLNVMFTSVVNNGVGPYTFTYDYGMGYTTTSEDNIAYQTYNTQGSYNPSVHVVDLNGNAGDAMCGLIVATENMNYTLEANAGGPYTGYIDEPVTFDASQSVGDIVDYRWDFGDGTGIVDTTTPTIEHTYSNIKVYNVKLTVFNAGGHISESQTIATIIEHSNYKPIVVQDVPDKGILVQQIMIYGQNGEILKPNDDMSVNVLLKNEWTSKLENVRIIVSIPELGLEARSSLFDFRKGATYSDSLTLPLYNVKPGVYYVRISVDNDQGDNQVRRVKYREVIVK